jgi:hypothetical protein
MKVTPVVTGTGVDVGCGWAITDVGEGASVGTTTGLGGMVGVGGLMRTRYLAGM